MVNEQRLERIARDPRYVALVRQRNRFAWSLSALVVGLFTAFILVIALDKALFAKPVGGLVMTRGIPAGVGLILLAIVLIAVFTRRANRRYDPAMAAILADHAQ